jgi:ribosomal protein L16 Arg81 hydroxylase
MPHRIVSLADILHPITEEEFFAEYYERKLLHVPAPDPDKFADVMSWDRLSALLNMTAIWSPATFKLFLDRKEVPPADFTRPETDRDHRPSLQPDAEKVKDWLRRGASLVVNSIDTLSPELRAVADALETRLEGKVQSNLYCSWQQRRAFDAHMDTHDVFAIHVAGEKDWNIYEGHLDNPIATPEYRSPDPAFVERHRGKIERQLTLRPGDFLYIPRGKYHDALASSEACIHLTFGVTRVIGFDLMELLFNHAMLDSAFRTNFPLRTGDPATDRAATRAHIETLALRLTNIASSDAVLDKMMYHRNTFHDPRGGYDLPGDVIGGARQAVAFALTSDDFAMVTNAGRTGLKGPRGAIPIPAGIEAAVRWVVDRKRFTRRDLAAAFPDMPEASLDKLIGDLLVMKILDQHRI